MTKKTKSKKLKMPITIVGEGRDEWNNRYIKFAVRGSGRDIPPFSVEQITTEPKPLFAELGNAGWNAFTSKARNGFLEKLQNRKPQQPTFKVVTRLGWNSGAFVLPKEVIGHPNKQLECSFRDLDHQMLAKYRCKGTLKDWQNNIGCSLQGQLAAHVRCEPCLRRADPSLRFWTTVGWISNFGAR